jgi:predicted nucleotidyltransferase
MNKKVPITPLLKKFKREIKLINGDNLKQIILFGSYARSEAMEGSDVDVILIFKKEPSEKIKEKIREISNSLSLQYDVVISEFLVTQSEFERYNTPFLMNVRKEGISL